MRIFILYYQSNFIGNCTTIVFHVSSTMLVSQLKDMIFERFRIHHSQQRLSTEIVDVLVTLTNDWPLSFFYIREGSKINLEFIQVYDKTSEINSKKVSTNMKSKYLKTLGFYENFTIPQLGIIPESQNEYNDEMFRRKSRINSQNKHSESFSIEEYNEILIQVRTSIRNNYSSKSI